MEMNGHNVGSAPSKQRSPSPSLLHCPSGPLDNGDGSQSKFLNFTPSSECITRARGIDIDRVQDDFQLIRRIIRRSRDALDGIDGLMKKVEGKASEDEDWDVDSVDE